MGTVGLTVSIVLLLVLLNVNNHRGLPELPEFDKSSLEYFVFQSHQEEEKNERSPKKWEQSQQKFKTKLDFFDPNIIGLQDWMNLGFSEKQANSILNYRDDYGPFEKPTDLKKLYVVSDEKYAEIEPFIKIDLSTPINQLIEINTSRKDDLINIKGIGPYFSKLIIDYRDALGGFYNASQFHEIKGLSDEAVLALEKNVKIDQTQVIKINVNAESKENLKEHPYLGKFDVLAAILKERDAAPLESLDFLLEQQTVSEFELGKIKYYINY